MLKLPKRSMLLALLLSGPVVSATGGMQVELSSGKQQVVLLELFTSEGCSSCPPADRWLGRLKADPGLWKKFAPIAFHVDYWDYIGWEDRLAQPEFGDRQRRYAAEAGARAVYTPGFFRSGDEWLGWRSTKSVAGQDIDVGDLTVRISGDDVTARFDALGQNYGGLELHVALLGMNLETQVRAGENSGKTLRHDFAALGVVFVPMANAGTAYTAVTRLPETAGRAQPLAIVAWVSGDKRQRPVQSVGGFLPGH